jgi:hypothetical protein
MNFATLRVVCGTIFYNALLKQQIVDTFPMDALRKRENVRAVSGFRRRKRM